MGDVPSAVPGWACTLLTAFRPGDAVLGQVAAHQVTAPLDALC